MKNNNNNFKYIYISLYLIFIIININSVLSQSDISWIGTGDCTLNSSQCWDPSLPTSIDNILLTSTDSNIIELKITLPTTFSSLKLTESNDISVLDSSLIVTNDISLSSQSTLKLQLTDEYFTYLTKKQTSPGLVLLNASLGFTLKATSLTLNDKCVMNVFRSISKISGPFVLNDQSTLFVYSDVNSEPKIEVLSTALTGNSSLKFMGPSQILLNNTKNGIQLSDTSSIVAVDADQVQITGTMTLTGSNVISLTNSNLYLDILQFSTQSSILVNNSTLSILQMASINFNPKTANIINSVFTYKASCVINSPINIENSIYNFNSTTTINNQFNGKNVQFYLDNGLLVTGTNGNFKCSNCDYSIRNSMIQLDTFSNDGELKLYSSSLITEKEVTSTGNVFGYNSIIEKGITMESGILGSVEERTRLYVDGNVTIKENATIKLYLNSPMDYSWLNISGYLNTHSVEVYFYIELTDNTTMQIITTKGFVNPLNSENVKLFIYDPDNDVFNQTNSCQYTLLFNDTSVIVSTDYTCEDIIIAEGKSGLSKGALAGISIGMIVLASAVSFSVWYFTRKGRNNNNEKYKNQCDSKNISHSP